MGTAARIAFKDISNYIKENNIKVIGKNKDVWFVTPSKLDTKRQRFLNRQLGISEVNYFKNKNNINLTPSKS